MILDLKGNTYIQGASGESEALRQWLRAAPNKLVDVNLISCLVPGINSFDYTGLHDAAHLTTFMMSPALQDAYAAGRLHLMPLAYSQIARWLATRVELDVAVLHLTPPDASGMCSFGISPDFGPLAAVRARRRIGVVNASLPRPPRGPSLPLLALDEIIRVDDLPGLATMAPASPTASAIAARVAELIPDGATLQTGIGSVPEAVLANLTDRRRLRIWSGIVTDGHQRLFEAGALAQTHDHCAGVAFGSGAFYEFLQGSDLIGFASVDVTHGAAGLDGVSALHAVNSALEVDLFGQMNLEWRGGRPVSGLGGAPDFVRAAARARDGVSITALAATADRGAISRIVPRLTSATVSIGRNDADIVVTEYGAASLGGLCVEGRAEALIAIAAPDHRAGLAEAWGDLRKRATAT